MVTEAEECDMMTSETDEMECNEMVKMILLL